MRIRRIWAVISIAILCWFALAQAKAQDAAPELKTATAVPVKYYLSLPEGWTAEKAWPILVTLDGSGHQFEQNCRAFMQARGKRPFILVTPCVSSNGNDPAELKAVLAIVTEVQKERHGEPKVYLTGFSAGGHVTWQLVFSHPELLAAVAPAAANFRFRGLDTYSKSPARRSLPIHEFQGDKDAFVTALTEQWNDAKRLAGEHGYMNLEHTIVPGAGHNPFAQLVVEYFESLRGSSRH